MTAPPPFPPPSLPSLPSPPSQPGADATVLLVTRDELLRSQLTRLAAGAGCGARVTTDVVEVRRRWPIDAMVLVGADNVADLVQAGLPRRGGVQVVAPTVLDADCLRMSVALGAEDVLELPAATDHLAALMGGLADSDRPPGHVVGVMGGSGGVGASVLTVALASMAVRRTPTTRAVAVDLDPRGAGLQLIAGLAGLGGSEQLGWDTLAVGHGRLNSRALRESLVREPGPAVLGWGPSSTRQLPPVPVVAETLAAARRGHDWVVVDGAPAEAWPLCDTVVVLVAATVHGVAAASRLVQDLPTGLPVGLAVRAPRRDGWGRDVARALSLPLWTVVTDQRALDEHLSAGLGPVRRPRAPLSRAATDLLQVLDGRR
jgi:secretion/DNA translocation related CpaE-like protein